MIDRSALERRLAYRVSRHPLLRILREAARERGDPIWLVGGTVRDAALGRDAGDLDLVSVGGSRRWLDWATTRFGSRGFRFQKRGVTTWRFRWAGEELDWVDASRRGLQADLLRRDFTFNAMAFELAESKLVDPLGGLLDLARRRLRVCRTDALEDDPVRVLRLARFAAQLSCKIDRKSDRLARLSIDRLARSPVERTVAEWNKLLRTERPTDGLRPAYRWGAIDRLLPEVIPMRTCVAGIERPNVEEHTLLAIEATATLRQRRVPFAEALRSEETRRILHWSLWLHDIAKPATFAQLPDGRPSFHGHEEAGARMADRLLRRLKLPSADRQRISRLIRLHLRPGHLADAGPSPRGMRRLLRDAAEDLPILVLLAAADALGSGARRGQRRWIKLRKVLHALKTQSESLIGVRRKPWLDGAEVMATLDLLPGPRVGTILNAMVDAQESGAIESKSQARKWLRRQV